MLLHISRTYNFEAALRNKETWFFWYLSSLILMIRSMLNTPNMVGLFTIVLYPVSTTEQE